MSKKIKNRNFGKGKKLWYAISQCVRESYGDSRYQTVASHIKRIKIFSKWLRSQDIYYLEQIDENISIKFAEYIKNEMINGNKSLSYSRNLLSTWNVCMRAVFHDDRFKVVPSRYLPKSINLATVASPELETQIVLSICDVLKKNDHEDVSIIFQLARRYGLRIREACLFDAEQALKEALEHSQINIVRGTKNGRGNNVDRWLKVTEDDLCLLKRAVENQQGKGSFIPVHLNLKQYIQTIRDRFRTATKNILKLTFLDLRKIRSSLLTTSLGRG